VSHQDEPFFIFNAMQVTHSPLLAPEGMVGHPACSLISDPDRKTFCAMVVTTDSLVQNTFEVMDDNRFKEDLLFVFSADNGGQPSQGGYNMPLRGSKGSVWEGGIRAASFIWWGSSLLVPQQQRGALPVVGGNLPIFTFRAPPPYTLCFLWVASWCSQGSF
jgi:arylsulfatase A-like enzyme